MIGLFRLFVLDNNVDRIGFLPVFNERFGLFAFAIIVGLVMAYLARSQSKGVGIFMGLVTQVVTLYLITSEIHHFYYTLRFDASVHNQEQTAISIAWALYAGFLTVVGFLMHNRTARLFGIGLFILTAGKVFIDMWSLGILYRIVSSIIFGIIALTASFLYSKYKDRLKEVL